MSACVKEKNMKMTNIATQKKSKYNLNYSENKQTIKQKRNMELRIRKRNAKFQ